MSGIGDLDLEELVDEDARCAGRPLRAARRHEDVRDLGLAEAVHELDVAEARDELPGEIDGERRGVDRPQPVVPVVGRRRRRQDEGHGRAEQICHRRAAAPRAAEIVGGAELLVEHAMRAGDEAGIDRQELRVAVKEREARHVDVVLGEAHQLHVFFREEVEVRMLHHHALRHARSCRTCRAPPHRRSASP